MQLTKNHLVHYSTNCMCTLQLQYASIEKYIQTVSCHLFQLLDIKSLKTHFQVWDAKTVLLLRIYFLYNSSEHKAHLASVLS